MISRREALLGVLLAPLVKPVAKMLPKASAPVIDPAFGVLIDHVEGHERTIYWSDLYEPKKFEVWDYTGDKAVCMFRESGLEYMRRTEERLILGR